MPEMHPIVTAAKQSTVLISRLDPSALCASNNKLSNQNSQMIWGRPGQGWGLIHTVFGWLCLWGKTAELLTLVRPVPFEPGPDTTSNNISPEQLNWRSCSDPVKQLHHRSFWWKHVQQAPEATPGEQMCPFPGEGHHSSLGKKKKKVCVQSGCN